MIGSSANNYITTYFRQSFNVNNPSAYASLNVRLLRDDRRAAFATLEGGRLRAQIQPGLLLGASVAFAAVAL